MMYETALTPENDQALAMYYKVANQFCYDLHFGPYILESHGYKKGAKRTNDLLDALILIHAIKQQKKEDKTETGTDAKL